MKIKLYLLATALILVACTNKESNETKEKDLIMNTTNTYNRDQEQKEAVQLVIEKLFGSVDAREWEDAKTTMTDSVYIDYTSLGGDAAFKEPATIINGWKQLLPGFDRTVHQLHNFAIWVAGDRASATFDGIATHYVDNAEWTVFVGYDTEFIKKEGSWKLARIDASLYDQSGDQQLPKVAMERVKNESIKKFAVVNPDKTAIMDSFFKALTERKLEDIMDVFGNDAVQLMPLAPKQFPKSLDGIDALKKQYAGVVNYDQSYDVAYFTTQNPDVYLAKYDGTITTHEGKAYNNSYVGIFKIENNKIVHFTEYFNPSILLNGWPGLKPVHYSLHEAGASTDSGVVLKEIKFDSNGVTLSGHLFLPPNFDEAKKYPAAIVTGSWTSVKEQMPDEYASVMAKDGFITMTFDFTGFGESEGQPRQVEDSKLKIADIKSAVDYLSEHSSIDTNKLYALGVCASAGYMAHATAKDNRIKKLVLIAPWLHNPEIARSIYDNRPGGTDGLLKAAREAKTRYAETGKMEYVLAASELDPLSAMFVPKNAFDYYLNPSKAAGPEYDNRFAVSSWEPWLTFDGINVGKKINQPVFIVHSESGAVPQGAKEFYELLEGEKEIKWLNRFNQQQLYFESDAVEAAMNEVMNYLK